MAATNELATQSTSTLIHGDTFYQLSDPVEWFMEYFTSYSTSSDAAIDPLGRADCMLIRIISGDRCRRVLGGTAGCNSDKA